MSLTTTIVAAGTGLAAGPWLRGVVFAHSVKHGQPPRGSCPQCDAPVVSVRWRGLLAVAPLRGRCPNCATRIGPPAGVVEALAAAALAVLAVRAPSAWLLPAWSWAALFGVALALIDVAVLRLPNTLTATAFSGVIVLLAVAAAATNQPRALVRAVLAAVGLGLLYLIAVLAPGSGMGTGDARLAPVIGACLGWLSITAVLQATVAAILVSALYVLVMLAIRRLHRHDPVPAGAFMLIGAFLLLATGTAG